MLTFLAIASALISIWVFVDFYRAHRLSQTQHRLSVKLRFQRNYLYAWDRYQTKKGPAL